MFGISYLEKTEKPKTLLTTLENLKNASKNIKKEEHLLNSLKEALEMISTLKKLSREDLDKINNFFINLNLPYSLTHSDKFQDIIINWLSKNLEDFTELGLLLNNIFEINIISPEKKEASRLATVSLIKLLSTPWNEYTISTTYKEIETLKNKFHIEQQIINDSKEIQDALKKFIKISFSCGSIEEACNMIKLMEIDKNIIKEDPEIQKSINDCISHIKKHQRNSSEEVWSEYQKSLDEAWHYQKHDD